MVFGNHFEGGFISLRLFSISSFEVASFCFISRLEVLATSSECIASVQGKNKKKKKELILPSKHAQLHARGTGKQKENVSLCLRMHIEPLGRCAIATNSPILV